MFVGCSKMFRDVYTVVAIISPDTSHLRHLSSGLGMFQMSFMVLVRWLIFFRQALLTWVWSLWPTWVKERLDSYKLSSDLSTRVLVICSSYPLQVHMLRHTGTDVILKTKCSLPTILLHSFVNCSYPMMLQNTRCYSPSPCACRFSPLPSHVW